MDDDYRELLRRLFVTATELIEDAHAVAAAGQSGALGANVYAASARRLQAAGHDIAAIAEAAAIIATLAGERSPDQ